MQLSESDKYIERPTYRGDFYIPIGFEEAPGNPQ